MSDIYNEVMLRRWSLDLSTGRAECFYDAIDVTLISAEDRAAIEAQNAELHAAMAAVAEYEAALRVSQPEEPHTQPVLDDEGQVIGSEPTEAYEAWTAAQVTIGMASDALKALARIRAGAPLLDEEGQDLDRPIVAAEWGGEAEITLPSAEVLARRDMPPLKPYQFHAILRLAGLREPVEASIAAIDNEVLRVVVEERLSGTVEYYRTDPLFNDLGPDVGVTPAEIDALWQWAETL